MTQPCQNIPFQNLETLLAWLDQRFFYCPETGQVTWLVDRRSRKVKGKPVGMKDRDGYLVTKIMYKQVKVHRLAWALYYREDPCAMEIDHVNGVKDDNRIENLRLATPSQNRCNRGALKPGHMKGTRPGRKPGSWEALIQYRNKCYFLGTFSSQVEAHAAYAAAARQMHGEFARVA